MDIVSDSKFIDNYINSKDIEIPLRGNALKMYYSSNNILKNNTIENSKDVTLDYSNNNKFIANTFKYNRFATHLSLSHDNTFTKNTYMYNSVAMMFMGAKNTKVINNTIQSSNGAAGIGVMIGSVSNFVFEKNIVKYNAKALYIDGKEKIQGIKRYINYNDISYNAEAFHFHASIKDNTITNNKIIGNIDDVVKDIDGKFSSTNIVKYNYWDRYAGFDNNNDNIGDTPHQIHQYADQLWHFDHKLKFFYATPIMSLLNFMSNLAPFIEPNLLLVDEKPLFKN
jgi:nitrous oxidase accessory protein